MTDPRFTDPVRKVVAETKGAGTDRLTFDCGHQRVVDHRKAPRKQGRCLGCRVWKNQP